MPVLALLLLLLLLLRFELLLLLLLLLATVIAVGAVIDDLVDELSLLPVFRFPSVAPELVSLISL